jgi:hypothetical protein
MLTAVVAQDSSPLLPVSQSRWSCVSRFAGRAWSVAKGAVGLMAGVPLIIEGAKLLPNALNESSFDANSLGESSYGNPIVAPWFLGQGSYTVMGAIDGLAQGAKYSMLPVGYCIGKKMNGRVGSVVMKVSLVAGSCLAVAGSYGTFYALKNGTAEQIWEGKLYTSGSFVDYDFVQCLGPEGCPEPKYNYWAQILGLSFLVRSVGETLLSLGAGMYFGRQASQ